MLTARKVIAATIAFAVVSVLLSVYSVWTNSPENNRDGADSYGTRADGFRAMADLLEQLDITVDRALVPDVSRLDADTTYVIWNPSKDLAVTEPVYLTRLQQWVREGGRLVVAISDASQISDSEAMLRGYQDVAAEELFEKIGLDDVELASYVNYLEEDEESIAWEQRYKRNELREFEDFRRAYERTFRKPENPSRTRPVRWTGEFANMDGAAGQLALPSFETFAIADVDGGRTPMGEMFVTDAEGAEQRIAASYRLGRGRVVVISEPQIGANDVIARTDNSVAVAHLLAGDTSRVVFDEFYHGLTLRGNSWWLWTRVPFATMTVALLLVVGVWNWRLGVFLGPPQPESTTTRRTILEYIDAMSRFLLRGRGNRQFVLQENRAGALWYVRHRLGLAPGGDELRSVVRSLMRKSPRGAEQFEKSIDNLDAVIQKSRPADAAIVQALAQVTACLSKHTTGPSATKSRKSSTARTK